MPPGGPLGGRHTEHDPHHQLNPHTGGRVPILAVQPRLGVRPRGRSRIDAANPSYSFAAWKDLALRRRERVP